MSSNLDPTPPPSLEVLLASLKPRRARLNNLLHRMDGMYQANLRSRDNSNFFQFGYGPTAGDALRSAIAKFDAGKRVYFHHPSDDERDPRMVGSTVEATAPIPKGELDDEWSTDLEIAAAAGMLEPDDTIDDLLS